MASSHVFSFQGQLANEALREHDLSPERLLASLDVESFEISSEIESDISLRIPGRLSVNVSIDFAAGSIEWSGFVEILDWMARLGGAIGLLGVIRNAINRALARRIPRVRPRTLVVYVGADPSRRTGAKYRARTMLVFTISYIWLVLSFFLFNYVRDADQLRGSVDAVDLALFGLAVSIGAAVLAAMAFWRSLD